LEPPADRESMELRAWLDFLRRRAWLMLLSICLALVGAYGVTQLLSPSYEASATLFVGAVTKSGKADPAALQSGLIAQSLARSYTEFASSAPILRDAERRLGRPIDDDDVSASVVGDTQVLKVSSTAGSSGTAADQANAVAAALAANINGPFQDSGVTLRIIDDATPPASATSPKLALNLLLGGLVGLLVGYATALGLERLDRRIRDTRAGEGHAAEESGLTVLGEVPRMSRRARAGWALLGSAEPDVAEPFRKLGLTVAHKCEEQGVKSLVITSPGRGEGKTTLAARLAVALSEEGRRVALVEADFRRPAMFNHFPEDEDSGIAETLTNGGRPKPQAAAASLSIFQTGLFSGDVHGLVTSGALAVFLGSLRGDYDLIVIDTPPVLSFADASLLSRLADAALLVVRQGQTSLDELDQARAALEGIQVNVLGSVVNGVASRRRHRGYGYYS